MLIGICQIVEKKSSLSLHYWSCCAAAFFLVPPPLMQMMFWSGFTWFFFLSSFGKMIDWLRWHWTLTRFWYEIFYLVVAVGHGHDIDCIDMFVSSGEGRTVAIDISVMEFMNLKKNSPQKYYSIKNLIIYRYYIIRLMFGSSDSFVLFFRSAKPISNFGGRMWVYRDSI